MNIRTVLGLCGLAALAIAPGAYAETLNGQWGLERTSEAGKVRFSLERQQKNGHGGHSNSSSDWNVSDFRGLDWSTASKHDVHFTIARDAGSIDCEGFVRDGSGAGLFTFRPNADYVRQMGAIGFPIDDEDEKQLSFAIQDVSLAFAKQMKASGVADLDADKLIAFRIFRVDQQFIDELRAAGLGASSADKLIAFRIHGVTPGLVQELRRDGYNPDEDKLVAMRIHGVTPEYMQRMRRLGYDHVGLDELVAFRIHGVSPEFVTQIEQLGFAHPEAGQLIAMRIHGVTPEYIQNLRSHGMQKLTIDQLVSLRIQGIN